MGDYAHILQKMSWLFGRRKHHKDSSPDSGEEEDQSNQDDNSFIVVERRPAPPPPVPGNGAPYPTSGLYPTLAGGNVYPHVNPHAASSGDSSALADSTSYLTGVPFKLCKELERTRNDDTEIDSLRVGEIESFLGRIGEQNYNYSFSLEQGIVDEMGMMAENAGD